MQLHIWLKVRSYSTHRLHAFFFDLIKKFQMPPSKVLRSWYIAYALELSLEQFFLLCCFLFLATSTTSSLHLPVPCFKFWIMQPKTTLELFVYWCKSYLFGAWNDCRWIQTLTSFFPEFRWYVCFSRPLPSWLHPVEWCTHLRVTAVYLRLGSFLACTRDWTCRWMHSI